MTNGDRLALAAYIAAVQPAIPVPRIITFSILDSEIKCYLKVYGFG